MGKTSSGALVTGGGVCVIVTDWMKMLTLSGAKVLEKWEHPDGQKYFENPIGAYELSLAGTDATVEWPDYDLRWVQKETGWVSISAAVMPDGDKTLNEYGDDAVKNDALELITLRFTKAKPDLSTDSLGALQSAYNEYRLGKPKTDPLMPGMSYMVSRVTWKQGDSLSTLLAQIVPEERVSRFATELTTDPFLMSLVQLRQEANKIDPNSNVLMGKYLQTTPWYTFELARIGNDPAKVKKLNTALDFLDNFSNSYAGQKIQCYGLGVLLSAMDNRFANIGGVQVHNAADLAPAEIRNGKNTVMNGDGYAIIVAKKIEDVNVGDFGVRYDTPAGHVFAVVAKKEVNGETVLLIASANQTSVGKVALFEVDKSNFDAVFGIPDILKVVLRTGTN